MQRKADVARNRATRIILTGGAERPARAVDRLCRKCGKLFALKYGHPNKRYCGKSCAALREKYPAKDCLVCASPFRAYQHKQLTCGPVCSAVATHRRRLVAPLPFQKPCAICSQPFKPTRATSMHCSDECRHEAKLRNKRAFVERKRQALAA